MTKSPIPAVSSANSQSCVGRHGLNACAGDALHLIAGIAFAPDSEAALHTKMLAAKEIVAIADAIPQTVPGALVAEAEGDGSVGS